MTLLQPASLAQCHQCRHAAFPIDATWLDDRLILASYPQVCAHVPADTRLTCTGCESERPLLPNPGLLLSGRRCAGRNRRGRPCQEWALPGSLFCYWHPGVTHNGTGAK
jgi:hypothetical protein